jgi:F-box-like
MTELPPELLSKIFQESLPPRLDHEGRLFFQTIRSVCPRWRSISLSTPVLWSSVATRAWDLDPKPGRLARWFSRAGPYTPLELEYCNYRSVGLEDEEESVKACIHRYQSRWRFLLLDGGPDWIWGVLFGPPVTPSLWATLDSIELFTFDFFNFGFDQEMPLRTAKAFDALELMPTLRRVLLRDCEEYVFTRQFGPTDLPELHMQLYDFDSEQVELLRAYPNLTRLALVGRPSMSVDLWPDHLYLPSLLSFSYDVYDQNLSLLWYMTTPALIELDIRLKGERGVYVEYFTKFLEGCSDTLESFTLDSQSQGWLVAGTLPSLSRQGVLSITVDIWPLPSEPASVWDSKEFLCVSLRDLTVSMKCGDASMLERMASLRSFLLRRQELGLTPLKSLTVHRALGAMDFPYELFKDVSVGRLCVMVPL